MKEGTPYNKGVRKNQLSGSYGDFKPVEVKSEGKRYPTDIVYFKTAESEGEVFHPTQKPIELGRYFIRTFTKENEVVLDNTCGSGSFMVAAVLEGRNYIGIELNEDSVQFKNKEIPSVGSGNCMIVFISDTDGHLIRTDSSAVGSLSILPLFTFLPTLPRSSLHCHLSLIYRLECC